jgi:hypothetical protein
LFEWAKNDLVKGNFVITDSGGNVHYVDYQEINGLPFFAHGVKDMINFYGLDKNYIAVFYYEDAGQFSLKISDKKFNEINYPVPINKKSTRLQRSGMKVVEWERKVTRAFSSGRNALVSMLHFVFIIFSFFFNIIF